MISEGHQTLIRLANWGQAMNAQGEKPFISVGIGKQKEDSGITIYASTEISRSQMIAMLKGFITGIEKGVIQIK